jgi:hypothetical protein
MWTLMILESSAVASTTLRGVPRTGHSCTLHPEAHLFHCNRGRDMPFEMEDLAAPLPHGVEYQKIHEIALRGPEQESFCQ